jgi:general secretion pathway protein J
MRPPVAHRRRAEAAFTLLEALVAMALMAIIMGALATLTQQWLPNWNRGLIRVQRNEQVAIALDRLVGDLSSALYVSPSRDTRQPLFVGTELGVTFVRTALGPNTEPGLEIVRMIETADSQGRVLIRSHAPFVPLTTGASLDQLPFTGPVILVRAPLHIAFSYAGSDGVWTPRWGDSGGGLPAAVRFIASDATVERVLAVSTATSVHVNAAPPDPGQQESPSAPQTSDQPSDQSGDRRQH